MRFPPIAEIGACNYRCLPCKISAIFAGEHIRCDQRHEKFVANFYALTIWCCIFFNFWSGYFGTWVFMYPPEKVRLEKLLDGESSCKLQSLSFAVTTRKWVSRVSPASESRECPLISSFTVIYGALFVIDNCTIFFKRVGGLVMLKRKKGKMVPAQSAEF